MYSKPAHPAVSPPHAPSLASIVEARRALPGIAVRTPAVRSESLSARSGHDVFLKLETLQPIGAFKVRGAAAALGRLSAARPAAGVVCASTGNHGRAVAYAARHHGMPATVCLSALVPQNKVAAIEALGATVRRIGASQDEAALEVARAVANEGMVDVPPFDHPDVIAGQGTIGLELVEDLPQLEAIVVPLSGGGLAAGIALAAKAMKPAIRVIGVSMARGAAMQASLAAGRPVAVAELPTLADSLGGGIGLENRWSFELCRRLLDDVLLLDEAEIYRAMAHLLRVDGIVAEGAAAVGVGALLSGKLAPRGPLALVISGRNLPSDQLAAVAAGQPIQLGAMRVGGRIVP